MPFWILVFIGLMIAFWRVFIVLAVIGAIGFGLFKIGKAFWEGWTQDLGDEKKKEEPLQEHWARFGDKPLTAIFDPPMMFAPYFLALIPLPFAALFVGNVVTNGWLISLIRPLGVGQQLLLYLAAYAATYFAVWKGLQRFNTWRRPDCPVFGRYESLLAWAGNAPDARTMLERAPSVRYAARLRFWGPRAFHRTTIGNQSNTDHPVYFDSGRLCDLLWLLEKHFPMTDPDETFRYRYWNYASSIWRVLSSRGQSCANVSMFGQAYPENPERLAQEAAEREEADREQRRARLAEERARMAESGRNGQVVSIGDALRLVGVSSIPSDVVLGKLEKVMLEKAEVHEREELALAFRILKSAGTAAKTG